MKVAHLTSVHSRYDTRIFIKMCSSLAANGYQVSLVVSDGLGDEDKNDVTIFDVGEKTGGRLSRMTKTVNRVFRKAKELNADIYHLHDPELIPIGLKLKKMRKKVIFDVHENISIQIMEKSYIPIVLRIAIVFLYSKYEKIALKKFDYLIIAEDSYAKKYRELNSNIRTVLNMPDINYLEDFVSNNRCKNEIFYIGGISNNRGLEVTIKAIKVLINRIPDLYFHCVGKCSDHVLDSVDFEDVKKNISFYGEMPLFEGLKFSKNAKVGISILKPTGNYIESYSTKIFEYMAVGLPVVTSNFVLYKNVIEKHHCGICVNPLSVEEIARAIEYIMTNPIAAKKMGENGRSAVKEKYNWSVEERKLLDLYKGLL